MPKIIMKVIIRNEPLWIALLTTTNNAMSLLQPIENDGYDDAPSDESVLWIFF